MTPPSARRSSLSGAAQSPSPRQPAIYVHIPFCEAKCPYCDFNSYALEGRDSDAYLDALDAEFEARTLPRDPPSIYVGGGTPTVLEPKRIERYLKALTSRIRIDPGREFTVEANPGTLTAEKIAVLREAGVNRISIGAQSLRDRHLKTLGRVHRAEEVEEAYRMARDGGIRQVSLDFIYSLPGMTFREWTEDLERALQWKPDHLSCYSLTFEPGTEFFARRESGRLDPAPERVELSMFRWTERRLRTAGLLRYEISSYARPGMECRHNLAYWRNDPYVGFGAGAVSHVAGERLGNEHDPIRYAKAVAETGRAFASRERLPAAAAAREMVVLGLRTAEGVDLGEVERRYGVSLCGPYGPLIASLRKGGFLRASGRLRLARRGWKVADEIASRFL
ncbi:MAG: radical SAM family heme chaperone HemW [Planctomycetota bacterium]